MSEKISPDFVLDIRRKTEDELIRAAQLDENFRAQLLKDPHAALASVFGKDPVPNKKINVIVESPDELTFVLPAPTLEDELPDELLDLASGGTCFSSFVLYGPPYPERKPKK